MAKDLWCVRAAAAEEEEEGKEEDEEEEEEQANEEEANARESQVSPRHQVHRRARKDVESGAAVW